MEQRSIFIYLYIYGIFSFIVHIIIFRTLDEQETETFGKQYRSMTNQFSIIMNVIMSVGAAFGICYYIASQLYSKQSQVCNI